MPATSSHLDSRLLRYFLTVAEELHFGRAAERLDITQPALSRAIRRLEEELDVELLVRTSRSVTLTAAGQALVQNGQDAFAALSKAVEAAREPTPPTRIALAADADFEDVLALHRHEARARATHLDASVLRSSQEAACAVRNHRADAGLVVDGLYDARALERSLVTTTTRVVALPALHPLARRVELTYADLVDEALPPTSELSTPPERALRYLAGEDAASLALRGETFDPARRRRGPGFERIGDLLALVEAGELIGFVPRWIAERSHHDEIAFVPVRDVSPGSLFVTWRAGAGSLAATRLASAARAAHRPVAPRRARTA